MAALKCGFTKDEPFGLILLKFVVRSVLLPKIRFMFFRNNILSGVLAGLLFPLAGYLILSQIYPLLETAGVSSTSGLSSGFRERTSAILAIALNLVPMKIFQNNLYSEALRGLVISTGILAIVWVIYFGRQMM